MQRNMLLGIAVIILVVLALIVIRPFSTSGDAPGQPSPHAIDQ